MKEDRAGADEFQYMLSSRNVNLTWDLLGFLCHQQLFVKPNAVPGLSIGPRKRELLSLL